MICEISYLLLQCFTMTDEVVILWAVSSGCVCCAVMSVQNKRVEQMGQRGANCGPQNSSTSRVNDSQCICQPILPTVSVSDVWLLNSQTNTLAPWCVGLFNPAWEIHFQCHSYRDLFWVESLVVIMGSSQQGVYGQATLTFHSLHVWVSFEESQHLWIGIYWTSTDNKWLLWTQFKCNNFK